MRPLPYPQKFPFCDLLLCEFAQDVETNSTKVPETVCGGLRIAPSEVTKVTTLAPQPPRKSREIRVQRSVGLSQFTYQPVVSRTFVGYRPSPKSAPEKILFWVKELLGCGHKQAMFPVPGETFTARKRHCGECAKEAVHAIEGKKPVERVLQPKRKQTGNSVWPLVWAFVLVVAAILWLRAHQAISYTYSDPTTFRVLRKIDAYTFLMQRVVSGVPQTSWTYHFCRDLYSPMLEQGMTLTWFSYEDRGKCISIAPAERGYVIQRGPDGWPTLPKNCRHVGSDVPAVCDGLPQF